MLINGKVFDVTDFKHPGGREILLSNAGVDATSQFEDIGHSEKAFEEMEHRYIGDFYNPDEENESSEAYMKRRKEREANGMSIFMKLFLMAIFFSVVFYLYQELTKGKL